MRKEWAREYYTLVTCHFFVQSFSNSSDSFTVKRIKKHSFLVIDIFLFLHNLFVNKFFFPGTTPKQSQMIIILQAKKERLVCESHCSNRHVYSLHAKEFTSCGQSIITPGFSLVSIVWSWNRKGKINLPLLQRRLHTARYTSSSFSEMFLVFLTHVSTLATLGASKRYPNTGTSADDTAVMARTSTER